MIGPSKGSSHRRRQVREHRAKAGALLRTRVLRHLASWHAIISGAFLAAVAVMGFYGDVGLDYATGQRVEHPFYAKVTFQVPNPELTKANKLAARADVPSYYTWNAPGVTFDRIRADLLRLYQIASDSETFEAYSAALVPLAIPADADAYNFLRGMAAQPEDAGKQRFQQWVKDIPLESEYVVRGRLGEPREPKSNSERIIVENPNQPDAAPVHVASGLIVRQENEKALRGAASELAKGFPWAVHNVVEAVILNTFREQPTVIFSPNRTQEMMARAEQNTPVALVTFEKGKPFIQPGELGSEQIALLRAHHEHYLKYLQRDEADAAALRLERLLQRAGLVLLSLSVGIGILVYTRTNHPRVREDRFGFTAICGLVVGTLIAARLLDLNWPDKPELIFIPVLLAAIVFAIVHPRRFALGAMCITALLTATAVRADFSVLLTLLIGAAVLTYQLEEIRARTKLITAGTTTAVIMFLTSTACGFVAGQALPYVLEHAMWAGGCALLAAFLASGLLPYIERLFRVATSLTLLEWRDPTRTLLQLLAREAPGTYNHSLVLGTMAQAACERIGANGLLTQVGALYHDIGKIPKADYFTENQEGRINRHDHLAPSMSLLIILGHVKDGLEMAREYKLPRVLHQFIEQHHGTTVVRYFHAIAAEKQPLIASGKHDREVSEAEFRYAGPKPRTREAAVLMLCDGVEGAVRALSDPSVGRIEAVVQQIVSDRLSDGQFDECDITLREIHLVEDSLVKSLCGMYHGRVAYPKTRTKAVEEFSEPERISV